MEFPIYSNFFERQNSSVINCTNYIRLWFWFWFIHADLTRFSKHGNTLFIMTPDRPATNIEPFVRKKSGEDVHRLFIDDPTKNDANKVYLNPWDNWDIKKLPAKQAFFTEKNNKLPFLDILRYLKNTHKNPKFGKVRQVPTREFPTKFPGWDLSHSSKFGIFVGIL